MAMERRALKPVHLDPFGVRLKPKVEAYTFATLRPENDVSLRTAVVVVSGRTR